MSRIISKSLALNFLKYAFAVGVLYWFWQSGRFDLKLLTKVVDPVYGPLIFTMIFVAVTLVFFRLHILFKNNGIHVPFGNILKASFVGLFYNFTLPGGAGGDVVKAFYLFKGHNHSRAKVIGLIITDRLIGVFGILIMAFFALILRPDILMAQNDLKVLFLFLLGALVGLVAVIVLLHVIKIDESKKLVFLGLTMPVEKILKFQQAAHYVFKLKNLAQTFSITLISQSITVSAMYVTGYFLFKNDPSVHLDLLPFFIVVPLGLLTTAIPISPGGIGVGQMAFYALFQIYTDQKNELGPTIVSVYQLMTFAMGLIGLLIFLIGKKQNKNKA